MKVFLGFSEVANFINTYRAGFELNGLETFTVVSRRNRYYPNAQYDVVLNDRADDSTRRACLYRRARDSVIVRYRSYCSLLKALTTCDIFIYITGGCILPFSLDYKLIRLLGGKLVVIFLGSEIRHWYVYQLQMKELGYAETFDSGIEAYRQQRYGTYREKLQRVQAAEKYADIIYSHPSFAQLQTKPYMRGFIGLELEKYKFNIPLNDTPLIVHAPTSRGVKGTIYVEDVIASLRLDGIKLDFRLIEGMANDDLVELLSRADIVIDELNSDSIGVLSTEAMATGNAVLSSYLVEYLDGQEEFPVINTNKGNLKNNLLKVITDREFRKKKALEGRRYVEKHNDLKGITHGMLELLGKPKNLIEFDVVPERSWTADLPRSIHNW